MLVAVLALACNEQQEVERDAAPGPDLDTDTDIDVDTDSDGDSDSDSDIDTDTGTGSDTGEVICDLGVYEGDVLLTSNADALALAGYTSIAGDLEIGGTTDDLSTLVCLGEVGGDLLFDWTLIHDLGGLDSVTTVGGTFEIHESPFLSDLSGLGALTTIAGHLSISGEPDTWYAEGNKSLASLDGLTSLTSIGNWLSIQSNEALVDISGQCPGDHLVEVALQAPYHTGRIETPGARPQGGRLLIQVCEAGTEHELPLLRCLAVLPGPAQGGPAHQQLGEQHAEGVDVGADVVVRTLGSLE